MAGNENMFATKWSVKNFSYVWQSGGKEIRSPDFQPENMEGTRWRLKLCSKRGETTDCFYIQLLREITDDGPFSFGIRYEFSIDAGNEEPLKLKGFVQRFYRGGFGNKLYVKRSEILSHLKKEHFPEDTLKVCCAILCKSGSVSKFGRCFANTILGTTNLTFHGSSSRLDYPPRDKEETVKFKSESPELPFLFMRISVNVQETVHIIREKIYLNSFRLHTSKLNLGSNGGNNVEFTQDLNWMDLRRECKFSLPLTFRDLEKKDTIYLPNRQLSFHYEITFSLGIESEEISRPEYMLDDLQNIHGLITNVKQKQTESSKREDNFMNTFEVATIAKEEHHTFPTTFKDDMASFYKDSVFHDVQIHVGTEAVPAHRDILRARSPVFRRMLETNMKEKICECINVTDMSLDTVNRMLLFLYTDTIGELELQTAKELYFAADKYDISSLKQRCSNYLKQNLQPSNVYEILVLADMHQDKELKCIVQEYILKYDLGIFCSDEWKSFMESNSSLAAEVMYLKCIKS